MAKPITIPPPGEIRKRIIDRRAEIAQLRRMLKLSAAAERAAELAQQHERKGVAHAR
jgi:hypothetical protein